ncbi:peptide-methionine (R)-S-oxide reductase MsrB [Wenxinia marina]|uniref:peptide-methionine (R)-S-oxide reductase n=1 Tax=Wenxinia marina DSM 24838 TaxID=1123501 RepID=A0A0D0QDP0_9RHOB|nr:peptide-methionine (R)-S-oxide reductase MsrB [Wenxinia marina]KIQ69113.1 methionine-R-sulfoxide reductase [Wenxinia marina DSM 24838]GGL70355.1 peptide-methionine (R)-S-oxide reductase [Wenxinia marina]
MKRRAFLAGGGAVVLAAGGFAVWRTDAMADESFEVSLSEAEWRERLTPEQFAVLREEATERAFSSPLNDEHREGLYHCAGCDQALYSSGTKFESGTGWPSFWAPLDDAVATKTDFKLVYPRTEVHCDRCGGHLGHIFDDGPEPTGKRHCLNGVALTFRPAAA